MNAADTFFYTWLEQLGKLSSLSTRIEELEKEVAREEEHSDKGSASVGAQKALAEISTLQQERNKTQQAAAYNKKELTRVVEEAPDQEIIIGPKALAHGLTPHAYRLFIDKGQLQYLTLSS